MTKTEFYETHLQKLRNDLIQDILHLVEKQKANELSFHEPIAFQEIDDQFSQTIDGIKANGNVDVCVSYGENYDWDLTDFHNDILLSVLKELEEGNFEIVVEEIGE